MCLGPTSCPQTCRSFSRQSMISTPRRRACWNRLRISCLLWIAAVLQASDQAQACSVCFGDPDSDMTRGALWGVIVLGAIVYSVLIGGVALGVTWFVRARRLERGSPTARPASSGEQDLRIGGDPIRES